MFEKGTHENRRLYAQSSRFLYDTPKKASSEQKIQFMQKILKSFQFSIALIFTTELSAQGDLSAQKSANGAAQFDAGSGKASTWKSGRLPVSKNFTVAVKGQTDERLRVLYFSRHAPLEGRTVLEFSRDFSSDAGSAQLLIETRSTGNAIPKLGDDESYNLEITDRQAKITAPTTVGAMRGLETFLQLLESDRERFLFSGGFDFRPPRFAWRGLMIDSARHFQPMEVLKRNLDAMAAVKLNVLHWHLTEDQGFRVESKKFPELHQMGSDGIFTRRNKSAKSSITPPTAEFA
jgi:hypothetical protein